MKTTIRISGETDLTVETFDDVFDIELRVSDGTISNFSITPEEFTNLIAAFKQIEKMNQLEDLLILNN